MPWTQGIQREGRPDPSNPSILICEPRRYPDGNKATSRLGSRKVNVPGMTQPAVRGAGGVQPGMFTPVGDTVFGALGRVGTIDWLIRALFNVQNMLSHG